MNGPFFRNYNQQPARYVPVQHSEQRSSPKVVSVPVHFISSEQPRTTLSMLKDSAAVKIQRVFRGFLVRKSVKKIASIRNEVTKIEQRIKDIEVVNLIRRDAKERLKVNESLMSLLFKLDSIRGVDSGIRDLRKAVTRKAIALQEKVDSIAQVDQQTLNSPNNDSGEIDLHDAGRNSSTQATETSGDSEAVEDDGDGGIVKEIVEDNNHMKTADGCGVNEIVTEDHKCVESSVKEDQSDGGNEEKGNRELLEKLMADNEKMMKLMMQISERNEMQTRMINSLSRRVEQLEKTFITDKLKRNKKTRTAFRRKDKYSFCTDFI